MGKKTFARKARLVEGSRWYIDFTTVHLPTGTETRSRKDFNLNTIADLAIRREVGTRIAAALEEFVIEIDNSQAERSASPLIVSVLPDALEQKARSCRPTTTKNYRTAFDWFNKWLSLGRSKMTVEQLRLPEVKAFNTWLKGQKEFTGRAINNYTAGLVTLWNILKEDGHAKENPWSELKRERVSEKKRRTFTPEERRLVASAILHEHYFMFRVVLLIYYCHIRPAELVRLKFGDFDLENGLIHVSPSQSKTWKRRTATIPEVIRHYFTETQFSGYPKGYFWLGRAWVPNATKPLNVIRLFRWHNDLLHALVKRGVLASMDGLTLYSWKDTGISIHVKHTSFSAAQDQAGHTTLDQTLMYYHRPLVNTEYRDLPDTLLS